MLVITEFPQGWLGLAPLPRPGQSGG